MLNKSRFSTKWSLLLIYFFWITGAWAANSTHFVREWSKIEVTGPIFLDFPDFRYESYIESRNQELRIDAAGGYKLTPLISLWSGFTWINPNTGGPQTYRNWQHAVWELLEKNKVISIQLRSRIEEHKEQDQPEWLYRWRERLRLAFPESLGKLTPVLYDEGFMNLNRPAWVSPGFLDANRAFIGIDTPPWNNTVLEIGYINQIRFTT
ncbi:MAG: DUF2490 domain-containing protein, partial [Proteobacteria bacterium]|nr:DUF2490 domain-containing protein [Pseudomonadota bacterium]